MKKQQIIGIVLGGLIGVSFSYANNPSNNQLFNRLKQEATYLIRYNLPADKKLFNCKNPLLEEEKSTPQEVKHYDYAIPVLVAILSKKSVIVFNGAYLLKVNIGEKIDAYKIEKKEKDDNKNSQNEKEKKDTYVLLSVNPSKGFIIIENVKTHKKIKLTLKTEKGE